MNRFALSGLVLLACNTFVGCHVMETSYAPSVHHSGWDPVLGSCDSCGMCGGTCDGHTPSSYVGHQLVCASGCGEVYWGPWLSDPPDECDPCDDCGHWVGEGCCPPKLRHRLLAGLHGAQHCSTCGGKGCKSCGKGSDAVWHDGTIMGGERISSETEAEDVLPPTPEPIEATGIETEQPHAPHRGFQIRSVRFGR